MRRPRPLPAATLAAALAAALAPAALGAQAAPPGPAAPADTGCVHPTPPSALTRVPVFVHAEVADSADRAARNSVDLVAQEVADRVRALLWATHAAPPADTATTLPPADSVLRAGAGLPLRVTAYRSGAAPTWRVRRDADQPAGGDRVHAADAVADTAAAALLARALGAAVAEHGVFVAPDAFRGDSLAFDLMLALPGVEGPARVLRPVRVRNPAPAFSLLVPWERHAALVPGTMRLRYPDAQQRASYAGRVRLQFVVDTAGRAEPATVRDVWPAGTPRPAGGAGAAYAAFVAAGRAALAEARFRPASVAGCPVRQLVVQPLEWTLEAPPPPPGAPPPIPRR